MKTNTKPHSSYQVVTHRKCTCSHRVNYAPHAHPRFPTAILNATLYKLFTLIAVLFLYKTAYSESQQEFCSIPKTYSEKSRQQVIMAEEYLNSIKNLSASFIQTDEHGNIQKGTFYLYRPGKMRWEYIDPNEILIIINNKNMVHYDKKLDQVSYFCSRNDFINLLVKERIDFESEKIFVKSLKYNNTRLKLILGKVDGPGTLTMVFSKTPFQIKKLEIVDDAQTQVEITLLDIEQPSNMDSSLFEFTNHKYMRKKSN